jgi:Leucine-rich repeat (LRR) protein
MRGRILFGIALVCIASAGCSSDLPEDRAAQSIANMGGRVNRSESASGKAVVEAVLSCTNMTDDGLKTLSPMKDLRRLDLSATKVTDSGLKELAKFKNLEYLDLSYTAVSNAGLKDLAALGSLKILILSHARITDAGIADLAGLKGLEKLDVYGTGVTDRGVKQMKQQLPNCKTNR